MSVVYLNGEYMNAEDAKISPMDRGFLFGDGIYEVIPSYDGKMLGFKAHIERMKNGLAAIEIPLGYDETAWRDICENLCHRNQGENLGIYLHVSRGADTRRSHAYPTGLTPTVFAFSFEIPPPPGNDPDTVSCYTVSLEEDKRWQRCNIKSTALLGNLMHFQQGVAEGNKETILYNRFGEITEASSSNVFIVSGGVIATPALDNQKLPGITRWLILTILREHSDLRVEERIITKEELLEADEVWVTSATKEIAPVVRVANCQIGNGRPGPVWLKVHTLFARHKFDY